MQGLLQLPVEHPIAAARLVVRPAISAEEKKIIDTFQRLHPPHFDGSSSVDTKDFLDRFHEMLHNLGMVESNWADFMTFQLRGPAMRWWQIYEQGRPTSSSPLY